MPGPLASFGLNLLNGLVQAKIAERQTSAMRGVMQGASILPGAGPLGPVIRQLPRLPGGGVSRLPRLPGLGTAVGVGGGVATAVQVAQMMGGQPRKRRRMNPYNPRAARRAIRRIKALRREMQKLERALPKQRVARQSRRSVGVRRGGGRAVDIINVD